MRPQLRPIQPLFYKGLFAILLCSFTWLSAQSQLNINIQSPDQTVCGAPDTTWITIGNPGSDSLINLDIAIFLGGGVQYVDGSAFGLGLQQTAAQVADSFGLSLDTLLPFAQADFFFLSQAGCGSVDTLSYQHLLVASHQQGVDSAMSNAFSLLNPALAIQSIAPSLILDSLGAITRQCISVVNGGLGALSDFQLVIGADTNALAYSNFTLGASGPPLSPVFHGDSISLMLDSAEIALVGNLDSLLDQNEVLELCFDVEIKECGAFPVSVKAMWGCDNQICSVHELGTNVISNFRPPQLNYTRSFDENTCYGAGQSISHLSLHNAGVGTATEILLRLWIPGNNFSAWDTSRIEMIDTSGTVFMLSVDSLLTTQATGNYACLGPEYIQTYWVRVPDMAPGDRYDFRFYMDDCCNDWCGDNSATTHYSRFDLAYEGLCDTNRYATTNYFDFPRVAGASLQSVNGPVDLTGTDTVQFGLTHSAIRFFPISQVNPSYALVELILPPGLDFPNQAGDLYWEDVQGNVWNPSQVTVSGDTIWGIFDFPAPSGFSGAQSDLKVRLAATCNFPCDGGPGEVLYNLYQVPDTTCACRKTISCTSWPVNVHCPGCPCPSGGIVFRDMEVFRPNLGLPDNNEDALADVSGSLDSAQIRMNYLMVGDSLKTIFHGLVDTTLSNPFWLQGYANSRISGGAFLTPIDRHLEIHDVSQGNVYQCPLSAPLSNPLGGDTVLYTYNFDTLSIGANTPTGFVFEDGDSLVLTATYRFSFNTGSRDLHSIENSFGMIDPVTMAPASCDSFGGSFVLAGYYLTAGSQTPGVSMDCGLARVHTDFSLVIGPCCATYVASGRLFRKEYRHWGTAEEYRVVLPANYSFDSANFTTSAGGGSTFSTAVQPSAILGDTVVFDLDTLYASQGGPIPLVGGGQTSTFYTWLRPNCQASINSVGMRHLVKFKPIPQLTGGNSIEIWTNGTVRQDIGQQEIVPLAANVQGVGDQVAWKFQLVNHSLVHSVFNSWFSLHSPSGNILPVQVMDLDQNVVLSPTNGLYQLDDLPPDSVRNFCILADYTNCALDSLHLISGWDCDGYPDATAAGVCGLDSVKLFVTPVASEMQVDLSLLQDTVQICDTFEVEIQVVSSQLGDIKDIDLAIGLPIAGGLSYVPGTALMEYTQGSGFASIPPPSILGNSLQWDVNAINALIAAHGLPGTLEPDSNIFTLRFALETNCDFISGQSIQIRARGFRACGDPLPEIVKVSPPIVVDGVVNPYSMSVQSDLVELSSCLQSHALTLSFINNGPGVTGPGDSIFVDLNQPYAYLGNFVGIHNSPNPTVPIVQSFANGSQLAWAIPLGIPVGDSIQFSFELESNSPLGCFSDLITISSVSDAMLFCQASNSFCNSSSVSGLTLQSISSSHPDLTLVGLSSSLAPTSGGYDYSYAGSIQNSGSDVLPGTPVTVGFYCDVNNNGQYDQGEPLIDQYQSSAGIPSGAALPFAGNTSFSAAVCSDTNQIIAVIFPDSGLGLCLCDTATGSSNVLLPTAGIRLWGSAAAAGNELYWACDWAVPSQGFILEKAVDGTWAALSDTISPDVPAFSYVDPSPGMSELYRIASLDLDGMKIWSNPVLIERDVDFIQLLPNPARDQVTLIAPSNTAFRVFDAYGKVHLRGVVPPGANRIQVTLDLPKGAYTVACANAGWRKALKLLVW